MSAPRKVKAVVVDLKKFKDDITWFRFKPELKCRFKPGQFLHLALDNYDPSFNWPDSRVFSIANAPNKDYIDILISPKGSYTKRMVTELSIGSKIWLKLPFGIFNFDTSINNHVILVAGGTGISPFISFLESLLEKKENYQSIQLFYGVRYPELIIFNNTIETCNKEIKEFKYQIFCENITDKNLTPLKKGILPVKEIVKNTSILPKPVYYLSGPRGMIESFDFELRTQRISHENIFYDRWE